MKFLVKFILLTGALGLLGFILVDKYSVNLYISQLGKKNTVENVEDYIIELRETMLQREPSVELKFKGTEKDVHEFVSTAIDQAFQIDDPDTSSDFDYLKYCYKGTEITIQGILNAYTITYQFNYNETLEQTKIVDETINKVFTSLELETKSEYDKIKTIHDYIITNASYDVAVLKNSAYENLVLRSSVCQGYASLTYKMMMEAGIDCRIITGQGKGVSHAWNIVKLDNRWYNIDCTWDDPVSNDDRSHLVYDYFLKSNGDFLHHIRDEEFDTIEFNEIYKMSDSSY